MGITFSAQFVQNALDIYSYITFHVSLAFSNTHCLPLICTHRVHKYISFI
uniref:Uncharacterized protein n=1 Tax=Anguilla anguilla TaxID=7936 RepID=A0A0E9QBY1_ANGAN